jgi:hypothetical protein
MEGWQDIGVLGVMLACGLVPFALVCKLMLGGQNGLALSIVSLIGAALAVALFASVRPFGVDPLNAIIASYIFLVPAMVGATAGMFLGWLIYRRRNPPT